MASSLQQECSIIMNQCELSDFIIISLYLLEFVCMYSNMIKSEDLVNLCFWF